MSYKKIKTALILDDESDIREIIEETLIELGYFCIKAPDIKTALQLFYCNKIDLMIVDISLPFEQFENSVQLSNGLEFFQFVKENNFKGKALCVSGFVSMLDDDPSFMAFDSIVGKPFSDEDIINALYKANDKANDKANVKANDKANSKIQKKAAS